MMRGYGGVTVALILLTASLAAQQPPPQVSQQDLLDGLRSATRWVMVTGDYSARRHSPLTQLTSANVHRLVPQWTFQSEVPGRFQATPLLLDGVVYVTAAGNSNSAWAIDARSGRSIWRYRRDLPADLKPIYTANRGFAMHGDRLFMGTVDAHVVALDMMTGRLIYDVEVADYRAGYAIPMAPLVVRDKVLVGVAGGDSGIRGFIDAYDVASGRRAWRFYTVPAPGEPGSETWTGDSWQRGGAAVWVSGAYDPALNLVYFGTGNPGEDYYGANRPGDNLYSSSLVALDADTGRLRWHYQFTPHDLHDWDATQTPVLADLTIGGQLRQVVMQANRNGFFYVLDRMSGQLLLAKPFMAQTWAKEIGPDGRPVLLPGYVPDEKGSTVCPDLVGGTNFMPPSFNPALQLFFVSARETCSTYFGWKSEFKVAQLFMAGAVERAIPAGGQYAALRALDPITGERVWELKYPLPADHSTGPGVTSTAGGVLFTGDYDGNVMAVDARHGRLLWHYQLGSPMWGTAPITYLLDGRQYILVPAGGTLVAFALPEKG